MTIRRWVQLVALLAVVFVTRNAHAIVVGGWNSTNCGGAKTGAGGPVGVLPATIPGVVPGVWLTAPHAAYSSLRSSSDIAANWSRVMLP